MTAKTLLDRHAKLEGRRAKLHQDARKALTARKGAPEDLMRLLAVVALTEGAHLAQLHRTNGGEAL